MRTIKRFIRSPYMIYIIAVAGVSLQSVLPFNWLYMLLLLPSYCLIFFAANALSESITRKSVNDLMDAVLPDLRKKIETLIDDEIKKKESTILNH